MRKVYKAMATSNGARFFIVFSARGKLRALAHVVGLQHGASLADIHAETNKVVWRLTDSSNAIDTGVTWCS